MTLEHTSAITASSSRTSASVDGKGKRLARHSWSRRSTKWSADDSSRNSRCSGRCAGPIFCCRPGRGSSTRIWTTYSAVGIQNSGRNHKRRSQSARRLDPRLFGALAWFRLLEECRHKKEALNPNSRRITIDLEHAHPGWQPVQIPVAEFYETARPAVEETIRAAEDLSPQWDVLYITGGGSELPLIARMLRERFGRRVRRSAYARSATAIGLAIQADQPGTYRLSERLSRSFGVWREADCGSTIVFDPLFEKGISLPSPCEPNLSISRSYFPIHNIGHFRFLECSHRSLVGAPSGEITLWDDIRFPFDPVLTNAPDLKSTAVVHSPGTASQKIEERYECDSGGSLAVTIANCTAGYSRTYRLGRWSLDSKPVKPARRRKR